MEFGGHVFWPEARELADAAVRKALGAIRRLVDFDGTITLPGSKQGRERIRGRPLEEFLAEEPYVVQTWNPGAAVKFFVEDRPDLARPVMILVAPMLDVVVDGRLEAIGKDFSALGLEGAAIFDDMRPEHILAPGCVVLPP